MGDSRFSGVIEVTVTARTPLLIGGFPGEETGAQGLPKRQDGTVMIPGSGLMGAVRSLHEALTGSCLRVIDADRVPVHRHPVNAEQTRDLVMAVVDEVTGDGRARSVRLCGDWVKIPKVLLLGDGRGDDDLPWTGDQLSFEPGEHKPGDALRVSEAQHSTGLRPGELNGSRMRRMGPVREDCWVLLVTDTSARSPQGRNGRPAPVQFAAGRTGPEATRCEISDQAWEQYRKAVEDADDLRTASLAKAGFPAGQEPHWGATPPEYADVLWPPRSDSSDGTAPGGSSRQSGQGTTIGRRLRARSYLHTGQPVWVRVADGKVTEIRLSLYWRYLGGKTVGERLGEARPCTEPANLCWSCRMFGSADTGGREGTDFAGQFSYRGHVRIDDLLAAGPVDPVSWELAPLASPKPGAGQFYLDNAAVPASARIARKDTEPAATWGSIADQQQRGPRPLRGRKFYWRTETEADPGAATPQRGRRREHQSAAMSGSVSLIPAGTPFSGRIAFDNLDAAEYGSLLAALDPRLLGGTGDSGWTGSVTSVGGGKPFGFGSVTIDVRRVSAATAAQRYLGESGPEPPTDVEAVQAFLNTVTQAARAAWPALRHALRFGFIDDAKVWYPPGSGNRGEPGYDKSFEFFAHTNGLKMKGDSYLDLVVLPDAAAGAAVQELDSAAGEHRDSERGDSERRAGRRGEARRGR
jgi:CRISPR/Cas system CSM-associated protein Csm3 (group 7 of RAMP superfamily)